MSQKDRAVDAAVNTPEALENVKAISNAEEVNPSIAPIVKVLEEVFQKLNERFFESLLSKPVITVSPNPRRKDMLGWCTTKRVWRDDRSDGYYEINICAEFLNHSFEEICSVLLHEMCHLLNVESEKKDTSRAGTYHNELFKETAEKHGLITAKSKYYGYSTTSLSSEAEEFVKTLNQTDFHLYRDENVESEGEATDGKQKKSSSTQKYRCPGCNTLIRATKTVHVSCDECNQTFELVD